jgi:hypothetical protein
MELLAANFATWGRGRLMWNHPRRRDQSKRGRTLFLQPEER